MRSLSRSFMADLDEGILSPITRMVRSDRSLCLELRGDYTNVYYRGGNLMKISSTAVASVYSIFFDSNYLTSADALDLPDPNVKSIENVEHWISVSPYLKKAMDYHFAKKRKDEREFQQLVLRDNNFGSIANSTDYFVCDIEYQSEHGRFDMVAVHWPSTSVERKNPNNRRLAFIEVKHGDKALKAKSGLHAHISDVNEYVRRRDALDKIKREMVYVFNQKKRLGLISCKKNLESFSDKPPLLLLAFVNHDPGSEILRSQLNTLPDSPHVELRIATASFLGYGLYDQGIHPLDRVKKYLGRYIYHKEAAPL